MDASCALDSVNWKRIGGWKREKEREKVVDTERRQRAKEKGKASEGKYRIILGWYSGLKKCMNACWKVSAGISLGLVVAGCCS